MSSSLIKRSQASSVGNSPHEGIDSVGDVASSKRSVSERRPLPSKQSGSPLHIFSLAVVIFVVAACAYANSSNGEFVIDDQSAIQNNLCLRSSTPLSTLFTTDFWGLDIRRIESNKSYRPLTTLSFRINFSIHGLSVFGYHVVNIFLHAIVSSLLPIVGIEVLGLSSYASFLAALVFSVHPIHTEAVASIVGRAELLCCLFYVLSILLYKRATESHPIKSVIYFSFTIICVILAFLSKETGITIPIFLVCLDFLKPGHAGEVDNSVRGSSSRIWRFIMDRQWKLRMGGFSVFLRIISLFFATISMVIFSRYIRGEHLAPFFSRIDNPLPFIAVTYLRWLTILFIHTKYAYLLVVPLSLSADYSFNAIPTIAGFSDYRILFIIVCYSCGLFLIFCPLPLSWLRRSQLLTCLFLLVIPFIPASQIFVYVGTTLAERLLYTPSLGFCFLIGFVMDIVQFRSKAVRNIFIVALSVVTVLFFMQTVIRNRDWQNHETIGTAMYATVPTSVKALNTKGTILYGKGKKLEAIEVFKEASVLAEDYDHPWYWLGRIDLERQQLDSALHYLNKAMEDNNAAYHALHFRGLALSRLGRHADACDSIERAHKIKPSDPEIALDLTKAMFNVGRKSEAIAHGIASIKNLPPGYDSYRSGILYLSVGVMLLAEKEPMESLSYLDTAKKIHTAGYLGMDVDNLISVAKSEMSKSPSERLSIQLSLPL